VGERGRRTQQRILTAALEVFDEVGYQSARIDAITERAGCSRPTFYQYFASKEALFNRTGGLVGASLVTLTEEFPTLHPGSSPPAELRAWVGSLVDLHTEWAPAFAAFRPALRGDPLLMAGAADLTRQYGRSLARSVPTGGATNSGSGDDAAPEVVAALAMTMLTGALSLRAAGAVGDQGAGDPATVTDQLTALVYAALVGNRSAVSVDAKGSTFSAAAYAGVGLDDARETNGDTRGGEDEGPQLALQAAALVVFPRLGLEGTRVDDLVAEAGVAHGTFYRYFDGKAELFEKVAGRAATAMYDLLADLPLALAESRIDEWTTDWFATYLDHGAILSVWTEAPRSEAGFSEGAAAAALDLLAPVIDDDGPVRRPAGVLGVLSLIEWSPYLVQQFEGFDLEPTRRAVTVILDRLLARAGGEVAA